MRLPGITSTLLLAAMIVLVAGCRAGKPNPQAGGTGTPIARGIPSATPYAVVPAPIIVSGSGARAAGDTTYVVAAGDTLTTIAARFGTTVEVIQQRNRLSGSDIQVGQQLLIPGGSAIAPTPAAISPAGPATATPRAAATATPSPGAGTPQTYVVQPGDSGLRIAFNFNITLEALAAANGMTTDDLSHLQAGQTLQIPRPR